MVVVVVVVDDDDDERSRFVSFSVQGCFFILDFGTYICFCRTIHFICNLFIAYYEIQDPTKNTYLYLGFGSV